MNPTDNRHFRIIRQLAEVAALVPAVANSRLAAGVVYKNEIIAMGVNKKKTDPMAMEYSFASNTDKKHECIYLHAEIEAIKRSLRFLSVKDLRSCSIYIARVKFTDVDHVPNLGLAFPCKGCMRAIVQFGLKNIFYTHECQMQTGIKFGVL